MRFLFLALLVICASLNVRADIAGESLELKLPDAESGVLFQLSKANPEFTLLSFWQINCEPCLKDMVMLSGFAEQYSDVRVLGVSISDKKSTRVLWSKHPWQAQPMPFPTLVNDGFPGELLKRFGNTVAAVPYTVMLNAGRQLCWSAIGQMSAEQLQQGLSACRIRA